MTDSVNGRNVQLVQGAESRLAALTRRHQREEAATIAVIKVRGEEQQLLAAWTVREVVDLGIEWRKEVMDLVRQGTDTDSERTLFKVIVRGPGKPGKLLEEYSIITRCEIPNATSEGVVAQTLAQNQDLHRMLRDERGQLQELYRDAMTRKDEEIERLHKLVTKMREREDQLFEQRLEMVDRLAELRKLEAETAVRLGERDEERLERVTDKLAEVVSEVGQAVGKGMLEKMSAEDVRKFIEKHGDLAAKVMGAMFSN